MTRNQKVLAASIVGLVASLMAASLMAFLAGPISWLAYTGWVIFFASLQSSLIMRVVQTGQADPCTEWLLRLVRLRH